MNKKLSIPRIVRCTAVALMLTALTPHRAEALASDAYAADVNELERRMAAQSSPASR